MDINLDEVIKKYIELRDGIDRINNEAKERIKPLNVAMESISAVLMKIAQDTGQTKFGTPSGTAFITTKTGCNIADKDGFWNWIQADPAGRRFMLTLSANKTSVGEFIEKNGTPPPGLNWTVMKDIQIRRS